MKILRKNFLNSIKKGIKYKVMPFLLVGTIGASMSACSSNNSVKKHYSNSSSYSSSVSTNSTEIDSTTEVTTSNLDDALLDLEDYELDKISVNFSEQTNNDFQEFISAINTEYKDSDLFNIDQALEEYNNMNIEDINSNVVINDNKVNEDKFYKLVKENNKKFLEEDKSNKYNNINDSQLKNIVNVVSEQINDQLSENANINTDILDNTLKKLKIFEFSSFGNAYVDMEDEKLCVSFKAIDSLQKNNPEVNMLERTIKHESDHLIQVGYPKDDEFKYNMGICYSYNSLKVNPLYWQWFAEGSAEKLTLKSIDSAPFNYKDQVMGLESITLSNITNKDCNVDDIEQVSLQKDLNKLFEYFNADTNKKKEEIIKLMYSYDIIFSDNKEFKETYNFDLSQLDQYKNELKASIGQTLSKEFYSNLSDSLVNQDTKIEDVYLLMRIFETEMCRITDYDNTTKTDINKTFVNNYSIIQNEFFDKLANTTDMNSKEVKQSYCAYSNNFCDNAKYKNEQNYNIAVDIDWLSNDQNDFLGHMSKSRVYHINKNINC